MDERAVTGIIIIILLFFSLFAIPYVIYKYTEYQNDREEQDRLRYLSTSDFRKLILGLTDSQIKRFMVHAMQRKYKKYNYTATEFKEFVNSVNDSELAKMRDFYLEKTRKINIY